MINSCEHSRLSSLNRSKLATGMHRVFMHVDSDAKNPGEPLDSDDWTLMIGVSMETFRKCFEALQKPLDDLRCSLQGAMAMLSVSKLFTKLKCKVYIVMPHRIDPFDNQTLIVHRASPESPKLKWCKIEESTSTMQSSCSNVQTHKNSH